MLVGRMKMVMSMLLRGRMTGREGMDVEANSHGAQCILF
jgi:hypothetical protein